jgi:hypothetical protein
MNIKTFPLLTAIGVGIVVQFIITLVSTGVLLRTGVPASPTDFDFDQIGSLAGLGLVTCLCVFLVDVGIGAFYSYLHSQEAPITASDGAIGGAATGAVTHFLNGIIGLGVNAFVMPILIRQTNPDISPEYVETLTQGAGGLTGGILGLCMVLVIGGILGAIGGAVGGALFKQK